MSFVAKLIDKRRKKELDRVNRELEELKRRGPDFDHKSFSPPLQVSTGGTSKDTIWGPIIICIIVVALVLIYSTVRVGSVKDLLDEKEATLSLLKEQLSNITVEFGTLENEIETKEASQSELSTDYTSLQADYALLGLSFDSLNQTLIGKEGEISDLQEKIDEKDQLIKDIENCIENSTILDKDDCI